MRILLLFCIVLSANVFAQQVKKYITVKGSSVDINAKYLYNYDAHLEFTSKVKIEAGNYGVSIGSCYLKTKKKTKFSRIFYSGRKVKLKT